MSSHHLGMNWDDGGTDGRSLDWMPSIVERTTEDFTIQRTEVREFFRTHSLSVNFEVTPN